ncbi:MAG: potassium channel family protein [Rubrobacteraceae bacterium]
MSGRQRQPEQPERLARLWRPRISDRFGFVLFLLTATVFFSVAAPNRAWAWIIVTAVLSVSVMVAIEASGARPSIVWAGLIVAATGLGASIIIIVTQAEGDARRYVSVTSLLLTLLAMVAIVRRVRLHAEISVLTVLGAVCFYVLLGLAFAFAFECVGEFGSRPFFTTQDSGTRSDYVYFSFVTMATVGYGDLTAQDGIGRALAVIAGILGQIYLVTAVAALVGNLGRTFNPPQEPNGKTPEDNGPE